MTVKPWMMIFLADHPLGSCSYHQCLLKYAELPDLAFVQLSYLVVADFAAAEAKAAAAAGAGAAAGW